jgi:hypothetical protein
MPPDPNSIAYIKTPSHQQYDFTAFQIAKAKTLILFLPVLIYTYIRFGTYIALH